MSGTSPQTGTIPSFGTQSGPLSSGAIPPASNTPSPTTTTLPTDRLDTIDQALSELRASQVNHDKLWVKQASSTSSLSDHINHLDQKLETFADVLSNNVKLARKSNDVALAALNNLISQLLVNLNHVKQFIPCDDEDRQLADDEYEVQENS